MARSGSSGDLAAFLRSRREALTPAEAGLAAGPRRRTPGLRRSEVAALAGISVEYLTRLEQGRDRHPSPGVVTTLGRALRLSDDEQLHLWLLSKAAGSGGCPGAEPPAQSVRPTVEALLRRLEPAPALVLDRLSNVLAHTPAFERLAGPVGLLDNQPANLTRYIFADPRARTTYPHWGRIADEHVARLRTQATWDAVHTAPLVEELTGTGVAFTERWQAPPAPPARTGVERWAHPDAGELRLAFESLDLPGADDQRLVVYLPDDEDTANALDLLAGRHPGALRVVGG